jgi:RimJ/RimL family protein N-acetyltransferase
MSAEFVDGITIRPLRNGESGVVQQVFDNLGARSRALRFNGAKNVLTRGDLTALSRVDATHHVLVALIDDRPVGIARLVRDGDTAEVAFAVVDDWQGRGVGSTLVSRLAMDARAAGVTRFAADVRADNEASLALVRRLKAA